MHAVECAMHEVMMATKDSALMVCEASMLPLNMTPARLFQRECSVRMPSSCLILQ